MKFKFKKLTLLKIIFFLKTKLETYYLTYKKPKEFNNFEEAFKFSENKTKGSYESEFLSRYRFEKTEKFIQEGGNLFNSYSMATLLFSVICFMKKNNGKCPKIIDLGSGCGESIIMLQDIFGKEILSNSWIIETPQQVKESKNWEFASNLNFNADIQKILNSNDFDIFFSSGCIQYLKEPFFLLEKVAKKSIPIIALTRNNFSFSEEIYVQESKLSWNGIGKHLDKYGDPRIYYVNSPINKEKLIQLFKSYQYEIVIDKPGVSGNYGKNTYSGDLVFSKIS